MKPRNDYSHLEPDLAEALREMDRAHEAASEGSVPVEGDWEFLQMVLNARIVEQAELAMKEAGINRAELARRMKVSRARVTTLLNEDGNFQLDTIAKLAVALNRDVAVRLVKKDEKVRVEPARTREVRRVRAEAVPSTRTSSGTGRVRSSSPKAKHE